MTLTYTFKDCLPKLGEKFRKSGKVVGRAKKIKKSGKVWKVEVR